MADLTKEYFDKQLGKLATKDNIEDVKGLVKNEITKLSESVEEKIDNLAMMVANGFEELRKGLDVRKNVENLNHRMIRIEHALNIKS